MKKKSGMTLIEVVAAIAILAGGVTVIYGGFMNSSKIWRKEKVNLELVSGAQSISQVMKARGKVNLETIFIDHKPNIYVYFDEYNDISDTFEQSDSASYIEATSFNLPECKSLNNDNKDYGALLKIQELSLSSTLYNHFKYYKIDMDIWNFATGATTQSTFYIGGDDN